MSRNVFILLPIHEFAGKSPRKEQLYTLAHRSPNALGCHSPQEQQPRRHRQYKPLPYSVYEYEHQHLPRSNDVDNNQPNATFFKMRHLRLRFSSLVFPDHRNNRPYSSHDKPSRATATLRSITHRQGYGSALLLLTTRGANSL